MMSLSMILLLLLAFMIVPKMHRGSDEYGLPGPEGEDLQRTRGEERRNVNLFLKDDLTMDTAPPQNGTPTISRLSDGEQLEFRSSRPLYDDLDVEGVTDQGKHGFKLFLRSIPPGNTECSMTVKIYDGLVEVGTSTFITDELRDNQKTIFFIEDVAPDRIYTFGEGNHLGIRINVSIEEGPGPVIDRVVALSYDGTNAESHLSLFTDQMRGITHATYRDELQCDSFEPNLPDDERYLDVKGEVKDAMGDDDIDRIEVYIYDPAMVRIHNESAEILPGDVDDRVSFIMGWDYPAGYAPGHYTCKIIVIDNNHNWINSSRTFEMSRFGLRITSNEYERAGMAGREVTFTITVLNTGGEDDTAELSADASPSGWTTHIDGSLAVPAGSMRQAELGITVPPDADEGDSCTVTVEAGSQGDGDISESLPASLIIRTVSNFMFSVVLKDDDVINVDNGEDAVYRFVLVNEGDREDSIVITVPEPPADWETTVRGDVSQLNVGGTYPREFLLSLPGNAREELTITLTAPMYPDEDTRAELEIAFTSQNESTMSLTRTIVAVTAPPADERPILTVKPDEVESEYDPVQEEFEAAEFRITIENPGKREWTVDVEVKGKGKNIDDWDLDYSPSFVRILPGAKSVVVVEITPPDDAEADRDGEEFEFSASVRDGTGSARAPERTTLTVLVEQHFSLILKARGDSEKSIDKQGTSVVFHVEILNSGNGIDDIALRDGDRSDWTVEFAEFRGEFEAGETRTVQVTVTAPDDIEDGELKEIEVTAESLGGAEDGLTLKVNVNVGLREHFDMMIGELYFWVIIGLFAAVMVVLLKVHILYRGEE